MPARGWVLVFLVATTAWIAACGDGEGEPTETTMAAESSEEPNCGEFCAQAGGFGAGEAPDVQPVEVPPQELEVDAEGNVAVAATCNLDDDCLGAIILTGLEAEYGRADLEIPAGETEDVLVAVTEESLSELESRGSDPSVAATIPLVDESQPVSFNTEPLTLVAPK